MCVIRVCVIRVVCARDETSEERCEKKTEVTICLFVTSGFRTNKRRKRDTSVFINKRKRERERERTHALIITLDFLSSSSLICIKEIERKSG